MLIERSNLVNISKLVVKEVIESSLKFGRQLDSDHIPLQHFFIVLEHVLRHGLRPKKVTVLLKLQTNLYNKIVTLNIHGGVHISRDTVIHTLSAEKGGSKIKKKE